MNQIAFYDVRPFWMMASICSMGSGILMLIVSRIYPKELRNVIQVLGTACMLMGFAQGLRFLHFRLGDVLCLGLGTVLMPISLSLEYLGVCWLKRWPYSRTALMIPAVLTLILGLWFTGIERNASLHYYSVSPIIAVQLLALARLLMRPEDDIRLLPDRMAGFAYGTMGLLTAWMSISAWVRGDFPATFDFHQPRMIANTIGLTLTWIIIFPMFLMMISERLKGKLSELAMRDSLTGLYNRRAFEELAEREMTSSARTGLPVTVVLFDLDHFKEINDALGHQAGDEVLNQASALLRASLREEDILCRWGGDEFCALLPHTGWEQAEAAVERIQTAFSNLPIQWQEHSFELCFSSGYACVARNTPGLDDLIRQADQMLYRAKKSRPTNRTAERARAIA